MRRQLAGALLALAAFAQVVQARPIGFTPPQAATCIEWRTPVAALKTDPEKSVVGMIDLGNLTVIDFEGDYARDRTLPRQEVARAFLQGRADDYDFLVVFTTFEFETGEAQAFYNALRNDVRGIGLPQFDSGAAFGSEQRLQGIVDMATVSRYALDAGDSRHPEVLNTLAHELMHRWAVGVRYRMPGGGDSDALLGRDGSHWSWFVDSDGSVLYGNDWQALPGGRFRSVRVRHQYSPLDLYLAGFIAAAEVPPTTLLRGAGAVAGDLPRLGAEIAATVETVAIEQIITTEGARVPNAGAAPKSFRAGLVLLKRPGEALPPRLPGQLERLRVAFQQRFTAMTGGRGTLRFGNLPRRGAAPGSPQIVQPSALRGDAAQVAAGLEWLRSRQQADGRFEDDPATVLRDTAYAVLALSELAPGDPAIARGRGFLQGAAALTLEQHAWRATALPSDRGIALQAARLLGDETGYRLAPGIEASVLDTQVAVDLLGREGAQADAWSWYVARSETWQALDGSFGVFPGGAGSLRGTALALANLQLVDPAGVRALAVRDRARAWLVARQAPDGGFGGSLSEAMEIFARQPAIRLPEPPYARLRGWVRARQGVAGDYGGSVYATSLALLAMTREGAPNLALAALPRFEPERPVAGTVVRIAALVENRGGGAAPPSEVRFHDGPPSAGGVAIGAPITVPALEPGARSSAAVSFDTRGMAGTREIHVVVDAGGAVTESSEADNTASAPLVILPAPVGVELALSDTELHVAPPRIESVPVEVVVRGVLRNLGLSAAGAVLVRASQEAAPPALLAEARIAVAASGSTPFELRFVRASASGFRLRVEADAAGEFAEADETDNVLLREVPAGQGVDLTIPPGGVSLALDAQPVAGRGAPIRVAIENRGASDAPPASLRVAVVTSGERVELPAQSLQVAAGARVTREVPWTPRAHGSATIEAEVDPAAAIAELDETNNRGSLEVVVSAASGIDLAIDDARLDLDPATPREAGPMLARARIRNLGADAAPATIAALFAGDPRLGGRELARTAVPGLAAGSSAAIELAIAALDVRGDTTFYLAADATSAIVEADEGNNLALRTVPVLALADLALSLADVELDPSRPVTGEDATARVRVRNIGQQAAAAFTVRLEEIGASAALVAPPRNVDTLPSGGSIELTWTWRFGLDPAPRGLRVEVDAAAAVAEIREDNNRLEVPLTLQDGTVFASQRWFSPNGDGVKDDIRVAWRLPAAEPVRIEIRNAAGRAVRRFPAAPLARGEATWDGRNDRGRVVPDGDYRIEVRGADDRRIGILDATVDTNRSTVVEAIDTPRSRLVSLPPAIPPNLGGWRFAPDGAASRFAVFAIGARPPPNVSPPRFIGLYRSDILFPALQPVLSQEWMQRYATGRGEYAGEVREFWFLPDGQRVLVLLRTEVSFGPYRHVFAVTRADAVDNPTLLGTPQEFPQGGVPLVEGFFDADTALVRWPTPTGVERRLLDIRTGRVAPFTGSVPAAAAAHLVSAQGALFRMPDAEGERWLFAPRDGSALRDLGAWRGAVSSPDRRALAGIREDGATQSVWLVAFDGAPPRRIAAVDRMPFVFAPDDQRFADQLTMAWIGRAGELMVVDAAAPRALFFSSAGESLGAVPLPVRHEPLAAPDPNTIPVASANGVYRGRITAPTIEGCEGAATWLAERPVHQWFDASGERVSLGIARNLAVRRTDPESGEWIPAVDEAGISWLEIDLFAGIGGESTGATPAWMFADGSRIGCDGSLWSSGGQRIRERWDLAQQVLAAAPGDDALLLSADADPASAPAGGRVLGSFLNLPTVLRAENLGRAIRLFGLATDRHFERWELEWAPAAAPTQWQLITEPSSTEVLADDFVYWTPPEPGTYQVRLRTVDRAGNARAAVVQVVSAFGADVGRVDAAPRAISPDGDGVQDAMRVDFEVRRAATVRVEIRDAAGRSVRTHLRVFGAGDTGPASWTWDGRADGGATVPDGRYTLWINEQRLPVVVDTRAPVGEPSMLAPSEASAGRHAVLQLAPPGRAAVADANLAALAIEFRQDGEWQTLRDLAPGTVVVEIPLEDYADRSFRLRATDLAGNRALFPLGVAREEVNIAGRIGLSRALPGERQARLESYVFSAAGAAQAGLRATRFFLPTPPDVDRLEVAVTVPDLVELEYQTAAVETQPQWQVRGAASLDAGGTATCATIGLAAGGCPLNTPPRHWQYLAIAGDPAALANVRPFLARVVGRRADGTRVASAPIRFDPDSLGLDLLCPEAAAASRSRLPPTVRDSLLRSAGIAPGATTAAMRFVAHDLASPDGLRAIDRIAVGAVSDGARVLAQESGGALVMLSAAALDEIRAGEAAQRPPLAIVRLRTRLDETRAAATPTRTCVAGPAPETGVELVARVEPLPGAECAGVPSDAVRLLVGSAADSQSTAIARVVVHARDPATGTEALLLDRAYAPAVAVQSIARSPLALDLAIGSLPVGAAQAIVRVDRGRGLEALEPAPFDVDRVVGQAQIFEPSAGARICAVRAQPLALLGVPLVGALDGGNPGFVTYRLGVGEGAAPLAWQESGAGNGPLNGPLGSVAVEGRGLGGAFRIDGVATVRVRAWDWSGAQVCARRTVRIDSLLDAEEQPGGGPAPLLEVASTGIVLGLSGRGGFQRIRLPYRIGESVDFRLTLHALAEPGNPASAMLDAPLATVQEGFALPPALEVSWDGVLGGQALAEGLHGLRLRLRDECGFEKEFQYRLRVDRTPPVATIVQPAAGATVGGIAVEIRGTVDDPRLARWQVLAGSAAPGSVLAPVAEGSEPVAVAARLATWARGSLTGPATIALLAEDALDNLTRVDRPIVLDAPSRLLASAALAPAAFSPNADGVRDSVRLDVVFARAARATVRVVDDGGTPLRTLATDEPMPAGAATWSWDGRAGGATAVADGPYRIELQLVDAVQAASTEAHAFAVDLDTTPPVLRGLPEAMPFVPAGRALGVRVTDARIESHQAVLTRFDGGAEVARVAGTAAGDFMLANADALAEAEYRLLASAVDRAGNPARLDLRLVVDRTAPVADLTAPIDATVLRRGTTVPVSGAVADANLERWELRLERSASPALVLATGTTVASADAALHAWPVLQADGPARLVIEASDRAGNRASAERSLVIDGTPPTAVIARPAAGATIRDAVRVEGTAADANFARYGIALAPASGASAGQFSELFEGESAVAAGALFDGVLSRPEGEYVLRLTVEDRAGLASTASVGLRIDAQPPTVPDGLVASAVGNRDVALDWNDVAAADLAGYRIHRNGVALPGLVVASQLLDALPPEGRLRYAVSAVDRAGNESALSAPAELSLDRTPPIAILLQPVDGAAVAGLVEVGGSIASTADLAAWRLLLAPDAGGALQVLAEGSQDRDAGTLAEWDTRALADLSAHRLALEAVDRAGNRVRVEARVVVDNGAPAAPAGLVATATGNDVALDWAPNAESDLLGYLVYRDGVLLTATDAPPADLRPYAIGTDQWLDEDVGDGARRYRVRAIDRAGNLSAPSAEALVELDLAPPRLALVEPQSGQRFDRTIRLRAQTADRDLAEVVFAWRSPGGGWNPIGPPLTAPPWTVEWTPAGLALGPYELRALARDTGGREDPQPPVVAVRLADLTPPEPPSTVRARADGLRIRTTWQASPSNDVAAYRVYRDAGATGVVLVELPATAREHEEDAQGPWDVVRNVVAIDAEGNRSAVPAASSARIFTPSLADPFTPVATPSIALAGSSPEAGTARLSVVAAGGAIDGGSTSVAADGRYAFDAAPLAAGENRIVVRVTDVDGNRSLPAEAIVDRAVLPPAPAPVGVAVAGRTASVSWPTLPADVAIGYRVFRNGGAVLGDEDTPVLTASSPWFPFAARAVDDDPLTATDIAPGFDGRLDDGAAIEVRGATSGNLVGLRLLATDPTRRIIAADVEAWSGRRWVRVARLEGNTEAQRFVPFDVVYRTQRIRLLPREVPPLVGAALAEIDLVRRPLASAPALDVAVPDGRHAFRVSAVERFAFEGPGAEAAAVDVGDAEPPLPVVLSGSVVGSDADLQWTASPSSDVAAYLVRRDGREIARVAATAARRHVDRARPNGAFDYAVVAVDAFDNASAPSNVVRLTINATLPGAPTWIALEALPEGRAVQLSWQAGAGAPPADYVLERADVAGGPFVPVATQSATVFRDAPLVDGRTYHYRVLARDSAGNRGLPGEVRSVQPRDSLAPSPPRLELPLPPGTPYRTAASSVAVCGQAEAGAQVDLASDRGGRVRVRAATAWNVRTLLAGVQFGRGPAIAPDGSLMFVSEFGRGSEVHDLDSGALLTRGPVTAQIASFAADARTLWFVGFDSAAIRRLDPRTLETGIVSTAFDLVSRLVAAPDGRRLFVVGRRAGDDDESGWLLDLQSGAIAPLGSLGAFPPGATYQWSADAMRLLFLDPARAMVVSVGIDGSRQETPAGESALGVRWLADGGRALLLQHTDAGARVSEIDLASGNRTERIAFPVAVDAFAADPAGRRVALRSAQRLDVLDLATGAIVATFPPGEVAAWAGGHRLVLWRDDVRVVDAPGGFCARSFPLLAGPQSITAAASDAAGNQGTPSPAITVVVDAGALPDLAIGPGDLRAVPAAGVVGERFNALVTVRNRGQAGAPSAPVLVRLASPGGLEATPILQASGPLAAGEARTLEFALGVLDAPGTWSLRAAVDGGDAIVEADESNNAAQRSIAVSAVGAPLLQLALRGDLLAPGTPLGATLAVTNAGAAFDGDLRVVVVDAAGEAVAEVLGVPVAALGFAERRVFDLGWPTGGRAGGSYRLRASLRDAGGTIVATTEAPFAIDAWRVVALDVGVPSPSVVRGEAIASRVRVAYRSGNVALAGAVLALRAFAADGAVVASTQRALGTLRPGFEADVPFEVATGMLAAGPVRITARLVAGAFETGVERSVHVVDPAAPPLLSGSIALDPDAAPILGRAAVLRWAVRNAGAANLPQVEARLRVLSPAGTDALLRTASEPIAAGGTLARDDDLAAVGLALGAYRAVLEARLPADPAGSWRLLAIRGFPIVDGEPPVIDAIEPDGTRPLARPITVRARVLDRHAGLDRVEVQFDDGAWSPMFGAIDGRQSAQAPALAEGAHAFRLRATDRYGNRTETAARPFVVDATPPRIVVEGVVDGQVGAQDVRPGIDISDANPDPAQDFLRLDGQPYVPGTPIVAEGAHVLVLRAVDRAGNRSERTLRFTIDRTPPALQFLAPLDGSATTVPAVDVRLASEAGARVVLQVGAYGAESTANGSGEAVFAGVPLQLGANTLRARASDAAGNASPERSIVVVRNDTAGGALVGTVQAAPAIERGDPLAVALQVRNDTGAAVVQQRFRLRVFGPGGAPLLDTREFTRDLAIGATAVEALQLATADWPLGQAALSLESGSAGAWQQLDAAVVQVLDGTPPVLAVVAPQAAAVRRNPVRVEAIASDPGGVPPTLRARVDGGPWIDLPRDPADASRFMRDLAPLAESGHALDVEARDPGGNVASVLARPFAVDDTAPSIAFGGVAEGAASNATQVVPTVSVADANPGTLVATLDGQPWASGTPVTAEGAHRIDAVATDLAGNPSTATLRFTLDRTPPTVQLTAPAPGAVVLVDRVAVSGRTEAQATVRVANGAYSAVLAADAEGWFTAPDVPLQLGENTLTAQATDVAGNLGPVVSRSVRHDPNAGATLEATLAVAPIEGEPGAVPRADWTLRNPGPAPVAALPVRLTFQRVGASAPEVRQSLSVSLAAGASIPGTADLPTVGRPLGAYEAVLEAEFSAADGTRAWTRIAAAPFALLDRSAPSVAILAPPAGSAHAATVAVVAEASDALSAIATVEARLGTGPWAALPGVVGTPGRYGGTVASLADGPTVLEVRATDAASQSATTPSRALVIDRVAPQVTITGVPPLDPPVNVPVLPVIAVQDATAVDVVATLDGEVYVQGTPVVADGTHVLRVTATDAAGNVADAEARFAIDRTPPTVIITQPLPGTQTPAATILFAGQTEPGASVRVQVGATQRDVLADASGAFAVADLPLAIGGNTLTATATDRAGNQGPMASVVVVRTGAPKPTFEGSIELTATTWEAGQPLPVPARLRNAGPLDASGARFRLLVQTADGAAAVASATATVDIAAGASVPRQFDFATAAWPQAALRLLLQHDRGTAVAPDWVLLDDHLLTLGSACLPTRLFADGFETGAIAPLFADGFEACTGVALPARPGHAISLAAGATADGAPVLPPRAPPPAPPAPNGHRQAAIGGPRVPATGRAAQPHRSLPQGPTRDTKP